jgi:hypothetical protein
MGKRANLLGAIFALSIAHTHRVWRTTFCFIMSCYTNTLPVNTGVRISVVFCIYAGLLQYSELLVVHVVNQALEQSA